MADGVTIKIATISADNKLFSMPAAVPALYLGSDQAAILAFKGPRNIPFQIGTLSNPGFTGTGVGSILFPSNPVGFRKALFVNTVLAKFQDEVSLLNWKPADGKNYFLGYTGPNNRLWIGTPSVGTSNAVSIGAYALDVQNSPGITNTAVTKDGITAIGYKCVSSFAQPNTTVVGNESLIQLVANTGTGPGVTAIGNRICNYVKSTPDTFFNVYRDQSLSVIIGNEACRANGGNYVAIGNKAARGTDAFFQGYSLQYGVPSGSVVAIGQSAQESIKPWGYPTVEGEGEMIRDFKNVAVGWNAFKNSLWVNNATVLGAAAGLQTTTNTGKTDDNILVQDLPFTSRPYFGGPILIGSQADWATRITKTNQTPNLVIGRSSTTSTDVNIPIAGNLYLGLGRPGVVRTPYTNSVFIGYQDDISASSPVDGNLYIKTFGSNALIQSNSNGAIAFIFRPSPYFYDYGASGARLRSSGDSSPPGWGIPNASPGATGTFQINDGGSLKTVTVTDGFITSVN